MESEENSNNQNADGDDQAGGGGSVCHDDSWVWYMNRCLKIVESKKTWTEARTECQGAAQSADLLSIGKNNVHFHLSQWDLLNNDEYYWVGGYQENEVWKWVDGTDNTLDNRWLRDYQPFQPDDEGLQGDSPADHIAFKLEQFGGRWFDMNEQSTFFFICIHAY